MYFYCCEEYLLYLQPSSWLHSLLLQNLLWGIARILLNYHHFRNSLKLWMTTKSFLKKLIIVHVIMDGFSNLWRIFTTYLVNLMISWKMVKRTFRQWSLFNCGYSLTCFGGAHVMDLNVTSSRILILSDFVPSQLKFAQSATNINTMNGFITLIEISIMWWWSFVKQSFKLSVVSSLEVV